MIEKKYILNIIKNLKNDIKHEISNKNLEIALELIYNCANILYQTNICYVDFELEDDLIDISNILSMQCFDESDAETLLFYDGFGENNRGLSQIYLKALCKLRRVVYVTYEDRMNDIPDLLDIINAHNGCKAVYIKRKGESFVEQIRRLNNILLTERPSILFHYSIPNDVVDTVIMHSYNGRLKKFQVNLTDHAFWLGATCIDTCVEFRDYGASISTKFRGLKEHQIVKLPFYPQTHPERKFLGYPFRLEEGQKVVFSGGALYKTLGDHNKYYKIVDNILSNYQEVIFWYAGNGDDTELKKILKKYPNRAYHTEERSDLFQVLEHARFYLSTYPICGGLMYQFAASAGRVPLTLKYDDCAEGFLLNQNDLHIEFNNLDELLAEANNLIVDDEYYERKISQMKTAVMKENDFVALLGHILDDNKSYFRKINFSDIDTENFRKEYLFRFCKKDICLIFSNPMTYKSSLKYFPCYFIYGCSAKLKRHYLDSNK